MNPYIFVSNQLHKYFPTDTLVKVGVCTAFLKNQDTKYEFGGHVLYKNSNVILFSGLPKRIEIDGENLIELFQYQHSSLLSGCYDLKQTNKCKFDEYHFEYDNKKYYEIEDVELLLSNL